MAKSLIHWMKSPIDKIVDEYLTKHNISAGDVATYTIERNADGSTWLTLKLWFNQEKTEE